ncbi:hypothetical protein RRG08_031862, partial [Elysia crispata]
MASILPQFPPFKIREDEVSAGTRWKKWFAQFENLITGMDITSMARKKALLIHYGGDEIFDLVDTFSADKKETYDALRQELDRYFTPRVNPTYEAFKLRKMKQIPQENVDQFHVRLRTQAALCSFTDIDREILAQLIEGITSSKLRKKALRERLTLDQLITEARNEELTETQARDIEKTDQACAISGKSQHKKGHEKTRGKQPTTTPKHKTTCRNCGGTFPHPSSRPCPAKGKTCLNCKKPNHFAKVCRSLKRADVKQVAEDNSDSDGVFTLQSGKKVPTTTVMINNHAIKFVVDTGASVNVITNTAYKALSPRPKLSPSSTSVYSYNTKEKLPILGCFSSRVRYKERTIEAQFYVVEDRGISPEAQKIKAITSAKAPTSISELRSFLGMTQFVSRYIESYASITEPLRRLTRKTQPWKWGREQDEAFKKLKKLLTEVGVMAYFDPKKETNVVVDASPCGLGAMIMQQGRVICYSSRALTDVESRYSQTEREMLAVVYGVEKFHIYLYGSTFSVITDHKPLLGIIGSSKPASARIDRWRLRLMPYQYTLTYRPGKDEANPADYLSRHPFITPQRDNDGENYIRYIAKTSIPNALTLEEVKQATASDKTLQNVMTAITTGNWDSRSVSPFKSIKDELTIHDGIVLRQSRILIPDSLQLRVVKLAHSAHQGIVKTKQLLREKVWFSGIDKLVETHLKGCIPCQSATVGSKQRDPIKTTPLPKHPWDELSADFAGPFPSGELLLIVIDDYSRFPEVQIVNSTSARTTIPKLMEMFSRFGTPSVLKTDNGAPFNSGEFAAFAKKLGFKHRKITPLWPEANGEAERFVRTLNKFVHTCQAEHSDWRVELQDLLCQYRATPHTSTKISPHEALTGRQMRTALPELKATHKKPLHDLKANDDTAKLLQKKYADSDRHTAQHNLQIGDTVLVRQQKQNKLSTPYNPTPFTVEKVKGNMVTATNSKHTVTRNSSFFKAVPLHDVHQEPDKPELESDSEDDDSSRRHLQTHHQRSTPIQ